MRLETQGDGMSGKWQVRKQYGGGWAGWWMAQPPDASDGLYFDTHADALEFAVSTPFQRLERWLSSQPKPWMGDSFWGAPSDRDDQGRPL